MKTVHKKSVLLELSEKEANILVKILRHEYLFDKDIEFYDQLQQELEVYHAN